MIHPYAIAESDDKPFAPSQNDVVFPAGVYTISKDITLSRNIRFVKGAILKPNNGVTVTISGSFDAGPYQIFDTSAGGTVVLAAEAKIEQITPQWWGAVADGLTSNTSALQAAIDSASNRKVFFPKSSGAYLLDTFVSVSTPMTFESDGATIQLGATGIFQADADDVTFQGFTFTRTAGTTSFLRSKTVAGDHKQWKWIDCKFDGVALWLTKIGRTLVSTVQTSGTDVASNCAIVGCEVIGGDWTYLIELGGQTDTIIDRNWIHNHGVDVNSGDGIKVDAGSTGTRITSNTITDCTRDAIDIYDSWRNTITDNVFRTIGGDGIDAKWSSSDLNGNGSNIVANNRAETITGNAFDLDTDMCIVVGNIAQGAAIGFRAAQNTEATVATKEILFSGNQAHGCTTAGFNFSNGANILIVGNQATDNTGQGFTVAAGVTGTFVGNVAVRNTGVDVTMSSNAMWVEGNVSDDTTYDRILIVPNNRAIKGRLSAGTAVELAKITAGGSFNIGETTNIATINVLASSLVEVWTKLKTQGELEIDGSINHDGTLIGLNGATPVAKSTGWGAPTGTATKTTFDTASVTLPQLAERVKALLDYLISRGDIGA